MKRAREEDTHPPPPPPKEFHHFSDLPSDIKRVIVMRECDAATQHAFFHTCRLHWFGDPGDATAPCHARDKHPPSSIARAISRHNYEVLREYFKSYAAHDRTTAIIHRTVMDEPVGEFIRGRVPWPPFTAYDHLIALYDASNLMPAQAELIRATFASYMGLSTHRGFTLFDIAFHSPRHMLYSVRALESFMGYDLGRVPVSHDYINEVFAAIICRTDVDEILHPNVVDRTLFARFPEALSRSFIMYAIATDRLHVVDRLFAPWHATLPFSCAGLHHLAPNPEARQRALAWLIDHGGPETPKPTPDDRLKFDTGFLTRFCARIAYATRNEYYQPHAVAHRFHVPPPTPALFESGGALPFYVTDAQIRQDFIFTWMPLGLIARMRDYARLARALDRAEYVHRAFDYFLETLARIPACDWPTTDDFDINYHTIFTIPDVLDAQRRAYIGLFDAKFAACILRTAVARCRCSRLEWDTFLMHLLARLDVVDELINDTDPRTWLPRVMDKPGCITCYSIAHHYLAGLDDRRFIADQLLQHMYEGKREEFVQLIDETFRPAS